MSSNNTKVGDISEKPPRIQNKFIRRNLVLDRGDEITLRKVKIKGLYPREMTELEKDEDETPYELNQHRYLNKKLEKCLYQVQMSSFKRLYWFNNLKNARNLENFEIYIGKEDFEEIIGFPDIHAKVAHVLQCLRKLPKNIRSIKIYIEELSVKKGHIQKLYRTLASFRHLKIYWRLLGFHKAECYMEEEYRLINRYLPRFHSLEEFEYDYWRYDKSCWVNDEMIDFGENTYLDQRDFQKIVKKNVPCPWITVLSLNIVGDFFATYHAVEPSLNAEESDEEDDEDEEKDSKGRKKKQDDWTDEEGDSEDEEEEGEEEEEEEEEEDENNNDQHPPIQFASEEEKTEKMREEIMPFYRYDLFPNLKKLNLQIFDDCMYPLDSFVVEGFAALKHLEQLELTIEDRPPGTRFFFDGLLELPLLNLFSLEIAFMRDEEWETLNTFFKKQHDLISIKLIIPKVRTSKEGYHTQNKYIENIWQCLENKPKLQYLSLRLLGCSLESISEGLKRTTMVNQLKLFDFEAIDDTASSSKTPLERVEGLCEFIRRQQDSLYYFTASLPFVLEADVVDHITKSASGLVHLREFELYINYIDASLRSLYIELYEKILEKENPIKSRKNGKLPHRSWYPQIAETLKGLKRLEDLTLYFGRIDKVDQKYIDDFLKIMDVLPKIRTLCVLELNLPFHELKYPVQMKIKSAILELRDVSSITLETDEIQSEKVSQSIDEVVDQVNQRQYLRTDLMF